MWKQYIGIDLHKAFFQVCAIDVSGEGLWEGRFARRPEEIAQFVARCTPATAVAVEASTPTWAFADLIAPHVGELRVVDPWKTKLKAGFAAKTDRLDARRLADALRRDSVVGIYYPALAIRELRELCRYRQSLVRTRTALVNRLRAALLRQGVSDARRLARTRDDSWLTTLVLPPRARRSVEGLRQILTIVRTQIATAEAEVVRVGAADRICAGLQQLHGIGPVLAVVIRAEVGDMRRFPTGGHLASYAGVVPRVMHSGGRRRSGPITRHGSPWLRWALVEAAVHARTRTDRRGRWARGLTGRKGALKARVAFARVLCDELHQHWLAIA